LLTINFSYEYIQINQCLHLGPGLQLPVIVPERWPLLLIRRWFYQFTEYS